MGWTPITTQCKQLKKQSKTLYFLNYVANVWKLSASNITSMKFLSSFREAIIATVLPFLCMAPPIGFTQELNKQPSRPLDCNHIQSTPAKKKNTEKENCGTYRLDKLMGTIFLSTKISKDDIMVVFCRL